MSSTLKDNQINFKLSEEIFNILTKGIMINKNNYCPKTHCLNPNTYFNEIESNYEQYTLQFKMAGLTLVDNVDFFYLIDKKYEEKNKQAIINKNKIYCAIIILVRYITQDCGRLYDSIKSINYGFNEDDFKGIESKTTYMHILEKTKLNSVFNMIKLLNDKGFIIKTKNNKYILTDSGKKIVNEIIEKNKIEIVQ
jgi:hypothetical protein